METAQERPESTAAVGKDREVINEVVGEAVAHIEGEDGKVLSEVQRGYMLHDRVLRPAMVVVGKGKTGTGEQENKGTREQDGGTEM